MGRDPNRVYTKDKRGYDSMPALRKYSSARGKKSFEEVGVGDETYYCQSLEYQIVLDQREEQKRHGTVLEWWSGDKKMGKRFVIENIEFRQYIRGIPQQFNGNILLLRCVEY